jgi:TolB-like protein
MHRLIVPAMILFLSGFAGATEQKLVPIGKPVEIAVMEFSSKGGVTKAQMEAMEDLLSTVIRKLGDFRVIGKSDLDSAMKLEQRKQIMGCRDDSCVTEIVGALGVRWLVMGNVSLFGQTYLVNLKLIDAEKVRIVASVSENIKGEQDELIEAVPGMTRDLFEQGEMLAKTGPGPGPATVVNEAPAHPFSTWGHVTLWSGAAFLAFGGVSAYMASAKGSDYDKHGDWDDLNASRNWTGLMWTGFGLGAALVTTGIVLWVLEPDGEGSTSISAGPMLDGSGMVFLLGGRW